MSLRVPVVFTAVVTATLVAAPAATAAKPTIRLSPDTVRRGLAVTVSGVVPDCNGPVTLISRAFGKRHTYAGIGALSARLDSRGRYAVKTYIPVTRGAKTYVVSARCGGAQVGVTANLRVTR